MCYMHVNTVQVAIYMTHNVTCHIMIRTKHFSILVLTQQHIHMSQSQCRWLLLGTTEGKHDNFLASLKVWWCHGHGNNVGGWYSLPVGPTVQMPSGCSHVLVPWKLLGVQSSSSQHQLPCGRRVCVHNMHASRWMWIMLHQCTWHCMHWQDGSTLVCTLGNSRNLQCRSLHIAFMHKFPAR